MITFAFGTAAPDGSTTVPTMLPYTAWPNAGTGVISGQTGKDSPPLRLFAYWAPLGEESRTQHSLSRLGLRVRVVPPYTPVHGIVHRIRRLALLGRQNEGHAVERGFQWLTISRVENREGRFCGFHDSTCAGLGLLPQRHAMVVLKRKRRLVPSGVAVHSLRWPGRRYFWGDAVGGRIPFSREVRRGRRVVVGPIHRNRDHRRATRLRDGPSEHRPLFTELRKGRKRSRGS